MQKKHIPDQSRDPNQGQGMSANSQTVILQNTAGQESQQSDVRKKTDNQNSTFFREEEKVLIMEEEVCTYYKFGFCKFKSICKRQHFDQKCENLSICRDIAKCMKRHPKTCKRFG